MAMDDKPAGELPDEAATPEDETGENPGLDAEEGTSKLTEQLQEALREKVQFRAIAQRAQADLVNYKHRAAEERKEAAARASSQLLLKLLPIADDLERAISHIPEDAAAVGWSEGIRLVQRNLLNIMEVTGLTKMEPMDRPFDPFESEAVQYQETSEAEEGNVIAVVRDGYKLHDKVLRAAQVVVAKKPQESDDKSQQTETYEEEATDAESTGN